MSDAYLPFLYYNDFKESLESWHKKMIDKDRPSTWTSYKSSLCSSCVGSCCTMPVEVKRADLTRLSLAVDAASDKQAFRVLQKAGLVQSYRAATGLFLLKADSKGRCPFLGVDHLCTVYEKRPDTCRDFPSQVGPRVGYCPYRARG